MELKYVQTSHKKKQNKKQQQQNTYPFEHLLTDT